ncbi:DUF882 domain-containing protein [Aureimonas sp. SA4125]|uniref:DUF882 domain-containing protein n=1 Tax=Aureimonas sp. SA4125 TaxID=2826993 RepID=UPI001CC7EFE8|nr:DUF882 domain-containing protein [Aureimonas sp. SA4125]
MTDVVGRAAVRVASTAALCALMLAAGSVSTRAETRTLKFYNLHTKEKASIPYKVNGRYSAEGLKKINWFLRDWRKAKPTNMDTRLLDLIWEAYRQSGSRDYINVICGYRSPATNSMLRSRSSGVAKESQHTAGRALDFFIPDVPLKKMREIGLKMQVGGVGYYPRSGSPFVHFDVGNARHWPRMSRRELAAVFPNGNTVHVPTDGKPLPGYAAALASYKARKGSSAIQVANASASTQNSGGGKTLFAALFGGGADEEDDIADAEVAQNTPATRKVERPAAQPARAVAPPARPTPAAEIAVAAMVPSSRPNLLAAGVPLPMRDTFDTNAPTPPAEVGKAPVPATEAPATEVAALDMSRIPLPHSAPGRERPTSLVAAAPAEASAADEISTLVAELEDTPVTPGVVAGAPSQLAYAVPTPRERPRFDSILKGATPAPLSVASSKPAAEAAAEPVKVASLDAVKRIVESSTAMRAAMAQKPKPVAKTDAADDKAISPLLLAAFETPRPSPAAAAIARLEVPAGKTGRFSRLARAASQPEAAARPKLAAVSIQSRIEVASIVADPATRAAVAVTRKPNADVLVRDVPTSVFTAGFTSKPLAKDDKQFVGSAVNFLPVAKFR